MARIANMRPAARSPRMTRAVCGIALCLAMMWSAWCFMVPTTPVADTAAAQRLAGQRFAGPSALATPGLRGRSSAPVVRPAGDGETVGKKRYIDLGLLVCFFLWYLGNYYYNITNKIALNASVNFPLSVSTLQLAVGCVYALFLWLAPDARSKPSITFDDYLKTLPVGFTAGGAHAASVFALGAGAVSFGQIVKAAEPAFAALVGTLFYATSVSTAKWICLIPVIGGVVLASLGEMDFAWAALITAGISNIFAAFKANENKKLMTTEGLKDRMGSVGNQFAITIFNSFLFCLPLALIFEGRRLPALFKLLQTNKVASMNIIFSGLWFYLYNELATITIKKTNAVTQSVANTAKRVIVIVGVALVLGESLDPLKMIGCTIGIGGVFIYSVIDDLVKSKK